MPLYYDSLGVDNLSRDPEGLETLLVLVCNTEAPAERTVLLSVEERVQRLELGGLSLVNLVPDVRLWDKGLSVNPSVMTSDPDADGPRLTVVATWPAAPGDRTALPDIKYAVCT